MSMWKANKIYFNFTLFFLLPCFFLLSSLDCDKWRLCKNLKKRKFRELRKKELSGTGAWWAMKISFFLLSVCTFQFSHLSLLSQRIQFVCRETRERKMARKKKETIYEGKTNIKRWRLRPSPDPNARKWENLTDRHLIFLSLKYWIERENGRRWNNFRLTSVENVSG